MDSSLPNAPEQSGATELLVGSLPVPGAFARGALASYQASFWPIPLGGPDGRVPLVTGWTKWRRHPGQAFIRKAIEQHPEANLGLITGPYAGITVIDVDDPAVDHIVRERYGLSPLTVRTPRGGLHHYFRSQGERSGTLRKEGLPIDIKGRGGLIVAPDSARWDRAGGYGFVTGNWREAPAKSLPLMKARQASYGDFSHPHAVKPGARNEHLFRLGLKNAPSCDSLETLIDVISTRNRELPTPLEEGEVLKIAKNAWGYQQRGENWLEDRKPRVYVPAEVLDRAQGDGDAVLLWITLRRYHFEASSKRSTFAIAAETMAKEQVVETWGRDRYRAATERLLKLGLIKLVRGNGRRGRPNQYSFCDSVGEAHSI